MQDIKEVKKDVLIECHDDDNGLWFIVGAVENEFEDAGHQEIQRRTLQLLKELMNEGLVEPGFPRLIDESSGKTIWEPWTLDTSGAISKIKAEWGQILKKFDREPSLGEVVWFVTTKKGNEVVNDLLNKLKIPHKPESCPVCAGRK